MDWDFAAATEFGEKAIALEPNRLDAAGWLATSHMFRGNFARAAEVTENLLLTEPLDIQSHRLRGDIYTLSGDNDKALEKFRYALSLSPGSARLNGRIARTYLYLDDVDAARDFTSKEPVDWVREMHEIMILHRDNKEDQFRAAAVAYENKYGVANSYQLAEIYAYADDLDMTFKWLRSTIAVRDPGGPWGLVSPLFDEARKDPRWAEFSSAFQI